MVYFKDAPLPPSRINPADIEKIQQFKQSISDKGGIFGTFEDSNSFQSSLRAHLSAIAQRFMKQKTYQFTEIRPELEVEADCASTEIDDLGYLDFMERFESIMPELVTTLQEINNATVEMGRQLAKRRDQRN